MMNKRFYFLVFICAASVLLQLIPFFRLTKTDQGFSTNKEINKQERVEKLQSEADALLSLFENMSVVPIFLINEPIIEKGANTERGVAYTTCEKDNSPTIFVKKIFYEKANKKQLTNILKHELTHAWQCRQGEMNGHEADFRKKFEDVGGIGN